MNSHDGVNLKDTWPSMSEATLSYKLVEGQWWNERFIPSRNRKHFKGTKISKNIKRPLLGGTGFPAGLTSSSVDQFFILLCKYKVGARFPRGGQHLILSLSFCYLQLNLASLVERAKKTKRYMVWFYKYVLLFCYRTMRQTYTRYWESHQNISKPLF